MAKGWTQIAPFTQYADQYLLLYKAGSGARLLLQHPERGRSAEAQRSELLRQAASAVTAVDPDSGERERSLLLGSCRARAGNCAPP